MANMKKGLDKYDLGTPMITSLLGGTADYGEGAKEEERRLKEMARINGTTQNPTVPVRNNMLT